MRGVIPIDNLEDIQLLEVEREIRTKRQILENLIPIWRAVTEKKLDLEHRLRALEEMRAHLKQGQLLLGGTHLG